MSVDYSSLTDAYGVKPDNNADVTIDNVAASVDGQGDLATLSVVTESYINVTNLSSIHSDLGTITGGSIALDGQAKFDGATSTGFGYAAVSCNSSLTQAFGLVAESSHGGTLPAVYGKGYGNARGVWGDAAALGVACSGGTTGLSIITGKMSTNSSVKVTNLNADLLDGLEATDFHQITSTTITVPAAGGSEGGSVLLEGDGTAYDVEIDATGNTPATTKWRVLWNSIVKVSVDDTGDMTIAGTTYNTSDARVKDDIRIIDNALEKVGSINGYTYNRLDIDSGKRETGVLAQELIEVLPEAVKDNDGLLTVSYGNIVGLLIESIKELSNKINKLEGEINAKK